MKEWLEQFVLAVRGAFGQRVRFIGIQGSRGRGEGTARSDIDAVVVLDALTYADLKTYDAAISALPEREKICGFISGEAELRNWDRADLFQFYHDTTPLAGSLAWMEPLITAADVRRAVHTGACNLYHGCAHNAVHEKSVELLDGLCKAATFVLRAKHYCETGEYVGRKDDLAACLCGEDLEILRLGASDADFDARSKRLLDWAAGLIRRYA
ncbi:MAG: nucleotidyltransferase domain-containing protein [Oscillospiraceae bacterium]|nr:nucleotidyltransferase domain-containing protein [Oscillospiraceae bacterium]